MGKVYPDAKAALAGVEIFEIHAARPYSWDSR